MHHKSLLQNGNDFWITELSSDTIYSLVNKELIPIAVQNPSAHSANSQLAVFPYGFNDYFFVFDAASLSMDEKYSGLPKNSRQLVWNRLTNQLEQWELYDSEIMSPDNSIKIPVTDNGSTMKNCGYLYNAPERLIDCYEKGLLKRQLKEIAPRLHEDDNAVIMLVKYNKEKILKVLTK